MQRASHADDELNTMKGEMVKFRNLTVHPDDFPQAVSDTLSEVSHFSILFWVSFTIALTALGLLICWYCGSRRRAKQDRRKDIEMGELPDTISEIAAVDMTVRQPILRRCCQPATEREAPSAPPYSK